MRMPSGSTLEWRDAFTKGQHVTIDNIDGPINATVKYIGVSIGVQYEDGTIHWHYPAEIYPQDNAGDQP